MNIETNKLISIKIGDAVFKVKDKGMEGFYTFQEIRDKEGMKGLAPYVLDCLVEIENVEIDSVKVELEEFKKASLPLSFQFELVRGYDKAFAEQITAMIPDSAEQSAKNGE
jgi:hypothetical protein